MIWREVRSSTGNLNLLERERENQILYNRNSINIVNSSVCLIQLIIEIELQKYKLGKAKVFITAKDNHNSNRPRLQK